MTKKFDPDKPHVKIRGMHGVCYEQDGNRFNAGHKYIGKADKTPEKEKEAKQDARSRAREKIAKKRGRKKKGEDPLDGFREEETPDAVAGAIKEDVAAKAAEEHA